MPRMWMVDPATMCNKHLVAEHHECHVFEGRIRSGLAIQGYLDNNLLEPLMLCLRHDDLAHEMLKRGMQHVTPIREGTPQAIFTLPEEQRFVTINRSAAAAELHRRCEECRRRAQE